MKNQTVSLIQAILALMVTVTSASLQSYALSKLEGLSTKNADVEEAKKLLLGSLIAQFVAAFIMIVTAVLVMVYRKKLNDSHMEILVYLALIAGTIVMFGGGVIGAAAATKLQCYKDGGDIETAWKMSTVTAILGIVGTMLMLMVQGFIRRDTIKSAAVKYGGARTQYPNLSKLKYEMPSYKAPNYPQVPGTY